MRRPRLAEVDRDGQPRARYVRANTERPGPRLYAENRQLRSTVGRLSDMVRRLEAEREVDHEWFGYEIHDRLAQTVVSALQQTRILQRLTEPASDARTAAARCTLAIEKALAEMRAMMRGLQPPMLDEVGLIRLVDVTLHEAARESGWQVETNLEGRSPLPRQLEVAAYRIISEAISNAQRHANATRLSVRLAYDAAAVEGSVVDDGIGFDVAAIPMSRSATGLASMRRRAEALDGHCRIKSRPGNGTTVDLWIPVRAPGSP